MSADMSDVEFYDRMRVEFFEVVTHRRTIGALQYGPLAFLQNNTFEMMYEELADLVNYAFFSYVKLRLLERELDVLRGNSPAVDAGKDT